MYDKLDTTEKGLRTYSSIFLTISLILSFILLICGWTTADAASKEVSYYYSTQAYWATFIPFLVATVSIVFVGFFIFLLINALAGIHENTRRTAELLGNKAPNSNIFKNMSVEETPAKDEWRCPSCNRILKNFVTTCPCGQEKNKNS